MPIKIRKESQLKKPSFEDLPSTSQSSYQTYNPITSTPGFDFETLWQQAIKRFGFSKEKPENNGRLVKRIRDINQSRLDYYTKKQDEAMIQAYHSELATLEIMKRNLVQDESSLVKQMSPIKPEDSENNVKTLPFENDSEFYQCAEPWGIKREDSLREKEATLIVAERNARERLKDVSILTSHDCENLENFHHDLVEIDKLKWYIDEVFLQSSESPLNTSQKKTLPKTLVTPLLESHEIEWAEITENTLKEFPYSSDRLKMQGLIQFMEENPIPTEEALAQLHRKTKDPAYETLTNFFDWLKNSYNLTDRQKYKKLEHAMAQQRFDWKYSPANDLRRALQQAQLSLEEIGENKFLESSLRDLLKHRIAPAYYMQIYQTPVRKKPIQHVALPTKHAHSETGKGLHVLNVNNVKQTSEHKELSEDRKQQPWNQAKFQQITQQLQEVSSELHKVKENVSTNAPAGSMIKKSNMNFTRDFSQIRCFKCNDLGHIAKVCSSNNQTSYRGNFGPPFRGRGRGRGYNGHRQNFQQNQYQHNGNFRERSQFETDQLGKDQSAQYADAVFDMNLNENHRWDYDSKQDSYLNDDGVEEINHIQSDSSDDVDAEDPL